MVLLILLIFVVLFFQYSVKRCEKEPMPEMTLHICLFGTEPVGFAQVVAEAENRMRDTLNVNLNFEFITPGDYKSTVQMQLMSDRKIALVYDAPWMTNNDFVSNGMYYDLKDYFNNDQYPGLKKAFPKEVVEANLINEHLYWIPIMGVKKDMVMLYIREDLREKHGVLPVRDMNTLEMFLQAIQENNPNMIPMDLGRKGFYEFFNDDVFERNKAGIFEPFGTGNMELYWEVAISEDGKTCLGATTYGDSDEAFSSYPEGFQYNYYLERFQKFAEWNQYLMENSITISTPSGYDSQETFIDGETAVCIGTLSRGSLEKELQEKYPQGKVAFLPLYTREREMQEEALYTTHIANNFIGIPITASEEMKERTMLFLDWLFFDEKNYELFRYGIEGRDYEITDNGLYKSLETGYIFPYYELVWNTQYELQNSETPEELLKYQEYMEKDSTYVDSPLAGFVYNSSNVRTQLAAVNEEYKKIWFQLFHGTFTDVEQELQLYHEKATEAGLEVIRRDLIRQVQTFLDNQQ